MKKVIIGFLALFCIGNAALAEGGRLKIDNDPYSILNMACSPDVKTGTWTDSVTVSICGFKAKADGRVVSIDVQMFHSHEGDWMFYRSASRFGGKSLEVRASEDVGSCRGGCSLYEHVWIKLEDEDFADCAQQGISIKVWGQGTRTISVSREDCEALSKWLYPNGMPEGGG